MLSIFGIYQFDKRDADRCYAYGWNRKLTLIHLAIDHGWDDAQRHEPLIAECSASPDNHRAWAMLEGIADDALDYLNSVTHPAYRWGWDRNELCLTDHAQWREWGH